MQREGGAPGPIGTNNPRMEPTISASQLYTALTTDPQFAIGFILENNPEAVARNLMAMGFDAPRDEGDMRANLAGMINAGQGNLFVQALSVPLITTNLLPEQVAVVLDVDQTLKGNPTIQRSWQLRDEPVTAQDVISGIATGILVMLNGGNEVPGNADGGGAGASNNNNGNKPPATDSTWKTVAWVCGAVAVIIIVSLTIRWARKRKS